MPNHLLSGESTQSGRESQTSHAAAWLAALGTVSCLVYAVVASMSRQFTDAAPGGERPVLSFFVLMAAAFVCYLLAIRVAVNSGSRHGLPTIVIGFACAFRAVLLFSTPILEIDIYRYLWDGQAVVCGVNPYRYSPQQVRNARAGQPLSDSLARLVHARDSSPEIATILYRCHHADLTTVYPPVSQAVFAIAAWSTPLGTGVDTRLVVMKSILLVFDVATIWILLQILASTGRAAGWVVAYAWCPLVLKEFANSGHLDSIAVCLTVLAAFLVVQAAFPAAKAAHAPPDGTRSFQSVPGRASATLIAAGLVLGLAVGAKLFPVVLSPLLLVAARKRAGWLIAAVVAGVFLCTSILVCWPMLTGSDRDVSTVGADSVQPERPAHLPPLPPGAVAADEDGMMNTVDDGTRQPGPGLQEFLARWAMNDFLFLLLVENLTPAGDRGSDVEPWFSLTPDDWRTGLTSRVAQTMQVDPDRAAFLIARSIAACIFLMVAAYWAWQADRAVDGSAWLQAVFLTLAWFWLLLPTQNPWYWIWAVPFLPFARSRMWLAVSGLTLIYYLRFWFAGHWPAAPVGPTSYAGKQFFDFVVVWIEFGPWFVLLSLDYMRLRRNP